MKCHCLPDGVTYEKNGVLLHNRVYCIKCNNERDRQCRTCFAVFDSIYDNPNCYQCLAGLYIKYERLITKIHDS